MSGIDDPELRQYLQSQVPDPGPGYWEHIDASLAGEDVPTETADREPDLIADVATNVETDEANGAAPSNRRWLAAAAVVVLAGIGLFALLSRSDEDPAIAASETDATTEEIAAQLNETPSAADDDASGEPVEAQPAGPTATAELDALLDESPLAAIQRRLAGQVTGQGEEGAGSAGPFCFSHANSYVFPADELEDRRALVWLEVAFDGLVNFYAMQGETIVISGSGQPDTNGIVSTTPIAVAGASGAPPYTIQIFADQISLSASEPSPTLVSCDDPDVTQRVGRLFELVTDPFVGQEFASWPPQDAVLSSAGLGPIRIGMLVSELEVELGADLAIETIDGNVAGACGSVATTTAIARDVWILVELTGPDDAIIRRVSTFSGPWFTPSGITVGSSQQDVIETFPGQIDERPHVYVDGTYMRFLPNNADDPNTVEFVNEGGSIAEIRAGDRDWVGLVEGCA